MPDRGRRASVLESRSWLALLRGLAGRPGRRRARVWQHQHSRRNPWDPWIRGPVAPSCCMRFSLAHPGNGQASETSQDHFGAGQAVLGLGCWLGKYLTQVSRNPSFHGEGQLVTQSS